MQSQTAVDRSVAKLRFAKLKLKFAKLGSAKLS